MVHNGTQWYINYTHGTHRSWILNYGLKKKKKHLVILCSFRFRPSLRFVNSLFWGWGFCGLFQQVVCLRWLSRRRRGEEDSLYSHWSLLPPLNCLFLLYKRECPTPQPPTLIPNFPHIHHHQRPAGKMAQHSNMVHSPLITYVSMLSLLTLCPPFVILLYVLPPSLFDLSIYLLFPSVSSILHSFISNFQWLIWSQMVYHGTCRWICITNLQLPEGAWPPPGSSSNLAQTHCYCLEDHCCLCCFWGYIAASPTWQKGWGPNISCR